MGWTFQERFLPQEHWALLGVNVDTDMYASWYQHAMRLLMPYRNVRLYAHRSPDDVSYWWTDEIDMLFEDSSHENPQLNGTLEFWAPLVRSGGIIAGHDYGLELWPDVTNEAQALAQRYGAELHVVNSLWWIQKP